MRLPRIEGVIERRILVNWSVDADVMARRLPPPFRPKLAAGRAVAGVCLIRLAKMKPSFVPGPFGLRSENAAHRVAVVWDEDGREREGVFVLRRDTDSCFERIAGGRVFPGVHNPATFRVTETPDRFEVALRSRDGEVDVAVRGRVVPELPPGSVFGSLDEASRFFEGGAMGWSVTDAPGRFHGLELASRAWRVEALAVEEARSSWLGNPERFPRGSVRPDCALLMRDIEHEWIAHEDLCCAAAAGAS